MPEKEFAPKDETNLESLLFSLQSNQSSDSKRMATNNRFCFCHDIISLSRLPSFFINLISFVILGIYDITICIQSTPIYWIESLSPHQFLEDPSSLNFIFSELIVQQVSFAIIVFIVLIVIFQWISFFFYDSSLHLSFLKSSFLDLSFNYMPFLLSPIVGTLFGSLAVATSGTSTQNTSLSYALILPTVYLFLLLNYLVFSSICEFNLIIKKSTFSCFSPPFFVVDAFILFLISFCNAFSLHSEKSIQTIGAAISMLWGISVFLLKRNLSYLSFFANILFHKLPLDAIAFSFLTIIEVWVAIPSPLLFDLWITIFIFDIGASAVRMNFYHLTTKLTFQHTTNYPFNPSKINSATDAINALRSGIAFKYVESVDREFLSWVLINFCSEALIVDVVRICLVLRIPLNELTLRRFSLAPNHLTSMKFIAFQIDEFRKYQSDDSIPSVKIAIDEFERKKESYQTIIDNDANSHSIIWLGKETKKSKKLFRNIASEYANSKRIDELWRAFCIQTLYAPSKAVSPPPNSFELLPAHFSFVSTNKESDIVHRHRPKLSSIERLTHNFFHLATSPFLVCVRLTFLVFLIFVIADNINYSQSMRTFGKIFTEISQIFIYGASLSYKFLKNIDSFSVLPNIDQIMSIIGINSVVANEFKSNFVLSSEEINNGKKYLSLFSHELPTFNVSSCIPMSLLLATTFEQPTTATIEQHRCYTQMMQFYIDSIANYTDSRVDEVLQEFQVDLNDDFIELIVAFIILTVVYICIFVNIKKKQVQALAIIKKINSEKYEYNEPGFSFSVLVSSFAWLLILCAAAALYTTFYFEVKSNSLLMRDCLFQMDMISDIARNAMVGLALAEFSILDKESSDRFETLANNRGNLVLESTQLLMTNGIKKSFWNVQPLTHLSMQESESFSVVLFDFGHMMINGNFAIDSYNFLMLRYLTIFNISQLANSTLENMMAASLFGLQEKGTSFWLASIGFLIFAIIAWALLEFMHSRQRLWFKGVIFIFRKELSSSPKRMRNMLKLLNNKHAKIIEKLPFPYLIVTNDDEKEIIDCNQVAAMHLNFSIEQIIGQKFNEFFDNDDFYRTDKKTLRFIKTPFMADLTLIRIEDLTSQYKKNESRNLFIMKMRPKIEKKLPIFGPMLVISLKFTSQNNFEKISSVLRNLENRFNAVIRISIGLTFYQAVVLNDLVNQAKESPEISALKFVFEVIEQLGEMCCGALTKGEVVVTPIVDSEVVSVICGEAADRAGRFLLCNLFGKCIVDEEIMNESRIESSIFVCMK